MGRYVCKQQQQQQQRAWMPAADCRVPVDLEISCMQAVDMAAAPAAVGHAHPNPKPRQGEMARGGSARARADPERHQD